MNSDFAHRRTAAATLLAVVLLAGSPHLAARQTGAAAAQPLGLPPPPLPGPRLDPPPRAPAPGPRLAQPSAPPQVRGSIAERPAGLVEIPSRGPALEGPRRGLLQPASIGGPATVLGVMGEPLTGAVRIAPNRVYDPVGRRYYWTSGPGAVERVLP